MWGGLDQVLERLLKEQKPQNLETSMYKQHGSSIKVNKNYDESGIETVTGISKLLLEVKEAASIV